MTARLPWLLGAALFLSTPLGAQAQAPSPPCSCPRPPSPVGVVPGLPAQAVQVPVIQAPLAPPAGGLLPVQEGWPLQAVPAAPIPPVVRDERPAIRKVLDDQVAAWNRGDLEGFMIGYWKSPELVFFSGKERTQGWQSTLQRYRKRYQAEGQEMGKLRFEEIEVVPLGPDVALVRGRWQLECSKDRPGGLVTLLFRKLPEGWRIVHDHTSN